MNVKYPTIADLARFRARIALTNKNAGYHYLALARVTRGRAWNDGEMGDPSDRGAPTVGSAYATFAFARWLDHDRLMKARLPRPATERVYRTREAALAAEGPTERQLNEAWGV